MNPDLFCFFIVSGEMWFWIEILLLLWWFYRYIYLWRENIVLFSNTVTSSVQTLDYKWAAFSKTSSLWTESYFCPQRHRWSGADENGVMKTTHLQKIKYLLWKTKCVFFSLVNGCYKLKCIHRHLKFKLQMLYFSGCDYIYSLFNKYIMVHRVQYVK